MDRHVASNQTTHVDKNVKQFDRRRCRPTLMMVSSGALGERSHRRNDVLLLCTYFSLSRPYVAHINIQPASLSFHQPNVVKLQLSA